MKKILLITVFLLVCINGYSQTTEKLYGKWQFKDIYKTDSEQKASNMIRNMLSSMTLELKPDMKYNGTIMGINESGVWKISDGALKLVNNGGGISNWKILDYKENEISLQLKRAAITLERPSGQ